MGNNLNKILEIFNLAYNDEFQLEGSSVQKFRFTLDGLEFYDDDAGWCEVIDNTLEYMLTGQLNIISDWMPKQGDTYYYLDIRDGDSCISATTWKDSIVDRTRYDARMIFETEDEAFTCAGDIFEFLAKR